MGSRRCFPSVSVNISIWVADKNAYEADISCFEVFRRIRHIGLGLNMPGTHGIYAREVCPIMESHA